MSYPTHMTWHVMRSNSVPSSAVPRSARSEQPLSIPAHGALASLIQSRSVVPTPTFRGVDECVTATLDTAPDEECAVQQPRSGRRLSGPINRSQLRSMRLIGRSNPRYRWERYWKTQEQLQQMSSKLCVADAMCPVFLRDWLVAGADFYKSQVLRANE